jgi:hypothetical protein
MIAVESGKKDAALAAADGLVAAYGSNPNVVHAIISSWYSAGEAATARDFLQRNIAKGGDESTLGSLDFYLAVLLAQGAPSDADKAVALKALGDAESHFKVTLGAENEVYGVIDEIRSSLQPAASQVKPTEAPADPAKTK